MQLFFFFEGSGSHSCDVACSGFNLEAGAIAVEGGERGGGVVDNNDNNSSALQFTAGRRRATALLEVVESQWGAVVVGAGECSGAARSMGMTRRG